MRRLSVLITPVLMSLVLAGLVCLTTAKPAAAQTEGYYLYRVTLIRAVPGQFNELLDALENSFELVEAAGDPAPFMMRHSQGDHWDFMILYPMESWEVFHSPDRSELRRQIWEGAKGRLLTSKLEAITSFTEEWFAESVSASELANRFQEMGLFHIEMFAGLPGKRDQLLKQRRMENAYYHHLDRQQNLIFNRVAGSNWDFMTIGFHKDLTSFAAGGNLHSAEEQEEAAHMAGFKGTDDIGPYLRSLLSYHNDTLAIRPR